MKLDQKKTKPDWHHVKLNLYFLNLILIPGLLRLGFEPAVLQVQAWWVQHSPTDFVFLENVLDPPNLNGAKLWTDRSSVGLVSAGPQSQLVHIEPHLFLVPPGIRENKHPRRTNIRSCSFLITTRREEEKKNDLYGGLTHGNKHRPRVCRVF